VQLLSSKNLEGKMTNQTPPPVPWSAPPPAPTGPAEGVRYAGFWIRLVAFILDGIVLAVIGAALGPLAGTGSVVQTSTGVAMNYQASGLQALLGLLYYVGFWAWRGQTPGMIPFKLRVVMADTGQKPDIVRALLRYVGLIISFVVLLLGVIWVAFDARKQGWHDKIASTVVVRPG
jgi:uncharacterized RDD family membrane protein YckC